MSFFYIISSIWRFWLPVILFSTTALTFVACNTANEATKSVQIPQLVTSIIDDPETFNAAFSSKWPNIFSLTFEGLTTENPVTGKVVPALAESWTMSDDKLQIVFTLRSGLKWSDGKPLTADDVVFTYNDVYLNKEIASNLRDSFRIGETGDFPKVRKLDARRIEFSLKQPFFPFLRATTASILPAHTLEQSVRTRRKDGKPMFLTKWGADTPPNKIIVNGPYKLDRYQPGQRLVFRRNSYYWRQNRQGNPQPYTERIVWQIVESTDTSLLQFRSGGLDAVMMLEPEYFSLLKRQEKQGNYKIYNGGLSVRPTFFAFNMNRGRRDGKPLIDPAKSRWFNTLEFRQAIAYAIDRPTMNNNTLRGLGELANSPIITQSPYYLSSTQGLKVYDYNPQKAKNLLLKAGFKYNNKNQLLDASGNRVRFTLTTVTGIKSAEMIGAQIQQDLGKIGIKVDLTLVTINSFVNKLANSLDWEVVTISTAASVEPNHFAFIWNPEGAFHMFNQKPQLGQKPIQGREVSPWEVEIGKLYIQGAKEFDEIKRQEIYAKTQQLAQEYLPLIYLVNQLEMAAVSNRVQNIKFSALSFNPFWNIYEITVSQQK